MHEVEADIWSWAEANGAEVVIPTNIGWKADGENVMGAGLAKQAAQKHPEIALWYGRICEACGPHTPVVAHPDLPLLFFPVKPLDYDAPHLSWRRKASLKLVERSTHQLKRLRLGPIALPMVGCGNGGLREKDVYPLLHQQLRDSKHITLVRYGRKRARSSGADAA